MVYSMKHNEKENIINIFLLFQKFYAFFDVVLYKLQISCFCFLIVLLSSVLQPEDTYFVDCIIRIQMQVSLSPFLMIKCFCVCTEWKTHFTLLVLMVCTHIYSEHLFGFLALCSFLVISDMLCAFPTAVPPLHVHSPSK